MPNTPALVRAASAAGAAPPAPASAPTIASHAPPAPHVHRSAGGAWSVGAPAPAASAGGPAPAVCPPSLSGAARLAWSIRVGNTLASYRGPLLDSPPATQCAYAGGRCHSDSPPASRGVGPDPARLAA